MAQTKRGDGTPWTFTATDGTDPVDLTTAQSIRLIIVRGSTVVIDTPVTGDANGVVTYTPAAADVEETGRLRAELEVLWPGWTLPQTFPTLGFAHIEVDDDLG